MKKSSWMLAAAFLGLAANARAVTSPSSLNVKIFEMRVSRNSDCSGAVSVFTAGSPAAANFDSGPSLGSGVISTGTYHCVMFHISDVVTFTPADNVEAPSCQAGTTYTFDVFQGPKVSMAPDGSTINGTAGEDNPWIYLSDAPTAAGTNGCLQPNKTGSGGPCPLAATAILSDQARSLVLNADNQVGPFGSGTCILDPGDPFVMSFR